MSAHRSDLVVLLVAGGWLVLFAAAPTEAGGPSACVDQDGDGYGVLNLLDCDFPQLDCDDTSASIHPGAMETPADNIDQDCDGQELCYIDGDGDGFGRLMLLASADLDCVDFGESSFSNDCDDGDGSIYPGATEVVADGVDQNCDASELCYFDADNDGYGRPSTIVSADLDCFDSGEASNSNDCDDMDLTVHPGATEIVADGVDQNCDASELCYRDDDGDGYGQSTTVVSFDLDCADAGEADNALDCNDNTPSIAPDQPEGVADGVDRDCDGFELCYVDADGDGFGSEDTTLSTSLFCNSAGVSLIDNDCDDTDEFVSPLAVEDCGNGIDDDCDGDRDCEDSECGGVPNCQPPDADGDGVQDNLDVCNNTPAGSTVDEQGRPLGDIDLDCDTDLDDYNLFQQGMTGPLAP